MALVFLHSLSYELPRVPKEGDSFPDDGPSMAPRWGIGTARFVSVAAEEKRGNERGKSEEKQRNMKCFHVFKLQCTQTFFSLGSEGRIQIGWPFILLAAKS